MAWFDDVNLNKQQKAAVKLMRDDLRFVFTLMENQSQVTPNFFVSFLPYFGLITDGIENWIRTYNDSTKGDDLPLPVFGVEETRFYERLRESIKIWDNKYDDIYLLLEKNYNEAKKYFSQGCNPFSRIINKKNYICVNTVNGMPYGNTIFDGAVIPDFSYSSFDGRKFKFYAQITGQYTRMFGALSEYNVNKEYRFSYKDYGGSSNLLLGNDFSDAFVLFSVLCQIHFVLYCVNGYILDECATKIRFSYILYYYLQSIIPEINVRVGERFYINDEYISSKFRNAMMHYGIGPALEEDEIIDYDILFGLSEKIIGLTATDLHSAVTTELRSLETQLGRYLEQYL